MTRPTEWLKNARKRAGYPTQAALATAMGTSRGAVGNWENGTDRPSMANAERLAVVLNRQRSEVLAKFGYPIGGGDPISELPMGLPPEWLDAMREAIAVGVTAGVVDGVATVLEQLRAEGLLPAPDTGAGRPRRRRSV